VDLHVDWEQRIDWEAVREHRLRQLVEQIKTFDLDAVMYTRLDALRYIISFRSVFSVWFHGTRYVLFVTSDGRVKFLVASGDLERVRHTMPWVKDYEPFPFLISQGVPLVDNAIRELGLAGGRIGVDMLPFNLYKPLRELLPQADFVDGYPVVEQARRVKHPDEVKAMRLAADVVDIGMETALDALQPGITEQEVSAAAAYAMTVVGSEDTPYLPLVCSGDHGSIGYRFPTDKRIRRGELVYIDCGAAIVNGYNGDIARTAVVGEATEGQRTIYRCMVDMLQAGTDAIHEGASTQAVAAAVQNAAVAAGYGEYTYYGIVGHGIGTDLHEAPTIGEKVVKDEQSDTLKANEIICLEPGVLVPGIGGGHVENMILVTPTGREVLTHSRFDEQLL
jgi:Xaa-Pro aminopeptidase